MRHSLSSKQASKFSLTLPLAVASVFAVSAPAQATLSSYSSNGVDFVRLQGGGFDISWTKDGNLLGTLEASNPNLVNTIISDIGSISDTPNVYDSPANSGTHNLTTDDFGSNGKVNWFGAQAFIKYLNKTNYGGSSLWALPGAGPQPEYSPSDTTSTEFGNLFYNELGSFKSFAIKDITATFDNEQYTGYWLATEVRLSPDAAYRFGTGRFTGGEQVAYFKTSQFYAWAITPGQVAAVPVPGAVWLFGSGMLGLVGLKRQRQA